MDNKIIKDSLIMIVLDAIYSVDDIEEVACYRFDLGFAGNRIKGVVKVEFEEVD